MMPYLTVNDVNYEGWPSFTTGGGRFKLIGSILGAYIIQMLTTTLYAMNVAPVNVKAYKAIVIIIIVVAGSPVVKRKLTALWNRLRSGGAPQGAQKEGVS